MDQQPIHWGVDILLVASCLRNLGMFRLMSHLARMQTLPYGIPEAKDRLQIENVGGALDLGKLNRLE